VHKSGRWWFSGVYLKWLVPLTMLIAAFVALVIILFHSPPRMKAGPFPMRYEALVLDAGNPGQTAVGKLHFLGAWTIHSPVESFGGLSALYAGGTENPLIALNDKGVAFRLPRPGVSGQAEAQVLPLLDAENNIDDYSRDSEALAFDAKSGKSWVGYEISHHICRYSVGFHTAEQCRQWPEMRKWPEGSSLESMARLPDGRFVAIAEGAPAAREGRAMLLFSGDPSDKATPRPLTMSYVPPTGYDPTDALWVGDNELLVLNRRVTLHDGFTAVIALVRLDEMKEGAVLVGQAIARLAPPLLADNFEGLALEEQGRQRILWVISDDNFMLFQRTLLLKFALPEAL